MGSVKDSVGTEEEVSSSAFSLLGFSTRTRITMITMTATARPMRTRSTGDMENPEAGWRRLLLEEALLRFLEEPFLEPPLPSGGLLPGFRPWADLPEELLEFWLRFPSGLPPRAPPEADRPFLDLYSLANV